MFTNVPAECRIKIFTMSGVLIADLEVNNSISNRNASWDLKSESTGTTFWDLRTKEGMEVAAGYYIYHIKSSKTGREKVGKFAVIK
jgi:predicted secreted protein